MQNTLPHLPISSPAKNLVGLARQIALPHEYAPQRFPSFPALERTALIGFTQPSTWTMTTAGYDSNKFLLARQAGCPLWTNPSVSGVGYTVTWSTACPESGGQSQTTAVFGGGILRASIGNQVATSGDVSILGVSGASGPTAGYPVVGVDGSRNPYTYVPDNGSLYFIVGTNSPTSSTISVSGTLTLGAWYAPGEETVVRKTFAIPTGQLSGMCSVYKAGDARSCWLRPISVEFYCSNVTGSPSTVYVHGLTVCDGTVTYLSSATTGGTASVVPVSGQCLLPAVAPSEYINSLLPWYSARTTAASALFTNVTQVLNKGGTALGGRVSPSVVDPFRVSSSYITNLHPAEKSFLALETGMYTYVPPSTDMADFWDYTCPMQTSPPNTTPPPVYRLDNNAFVNIGMFTCGSAIETLAVTLDWHLEFRTSSALFQVGISTMTLESLHLAQLALHEAGFFFENPTHTGVLKKVMLSAAKYAKVAAPVVSVVNPALGKALSFAGSIPKAIHMSTKPKPPPPSTSLRASTSPKALKVKKVKSKPSKR